MRENHVVRQKQSSTGYARISDIERWPMVLPGVHQNEIDYVTKPDAVSQIPEDTCKQQRAGAENPIVIARRAEKVEQDCKRRRRCEHRKKPSPKRAAFLQLAESYAGILSVCEIEKPADDRHVLETQPPHGPGFARLVEQINAERCHKVTDAPWDAGFQFSSIS
jgi:hypothetical protein